MKCFVGHSFKDEDNEIVDKFKKFIKAQGFQCITGEESQNTGISQKVIERIDESDFFIAVFTKDKKIDTGLFNKNKIYTTSCWVIQESGFALGRDKEVIFIVEQGIELPSLQGDLEYVSFNRTSLNKPFIQLAQMLTKIKARKGSVTVSQSSDSSKNENEVITTENIEHNPDKEKQPEIHMKMIEAIYDHKDYNLLEKIYKEEFCPILDESSNKLYWESWFLKEAQILGKYGAIDSLISLIKEHPTNPILLEALAGYYEQATNYKKAEETYLKAFELYDIGKTEDIFSKLNTYYRANNCLAKNGSYNEALINLNTFLNSLKDLANEHKVSLITDIANLALEYKDFEIFFIYGEYSINIKPENTELRFKLAYNYSQNGFDKLSLLHYTILINSTKSSMGLNNLGVQYNNFKMPAKAINCYKKSAEYDETLAMANIAFQYLNEGFVSEARELIGKANSLSQNGVKVHESIGNANKKLNGIAEKENEIEQKLLAEARVENEFMVAYSQAYCTLTELDCKILSGRWKTPFGEQEITIEREIFNINFKTDIKNDKQYTLVEIQGIIINTSVSYEITMTEIDDDNNNTSNLRSLLGLAYGTSQKYKAKGYAIINNNFESLKVLQKDSQNEVSFDKWQKL